MDTQLEEAMYAIFLLGSFASQMQDKGISDEAVLVGGGHEDTPKPIRDAVRVWARKHDCSLDEVPAIRAIQDYQVQLLRELRRLLHLQRERIVVAESQAAVSLVQRLDEHTADDVALADDLYIDLLERLPEYTKRARKVKLLILVRGTPDEVGARYREAVRSFIYGCPNACCALCGAIVEFALKHLWERKLSSNPDRFMRSQLIQKLRESGALSDEIAKDCGNVVQLRDRALHQDEKLQSDVAYLALLNTQKLLRFLFG